MSPLALETVSHTWQVLFVSIAVVIILLEIIRGWRLGFARQIVRLLAIIAAYGFAVIGGQWLLPLTRPFLHWPDPLVAIVAGAVLALVSYSLINALGAFLFKRTAQQESKTLRLLYGATGAFFGLIFGCFFVWLIFTSVRLLGSVAEAQVRAQESFASPVTQPVWNRRLQFSHGEVSVAPTPTPLVRTLAGMKQSLEDGSVGSRIKTIDPLPGKIYQRLDKLGEISGEPDAIERFLNYPGARQITNSPRISELRTDPKVIELVAHGRVLELLQNEKVVAAVNDPAVRAQFSKFDLDQALDYALKK